MNRKRAPSKATRQMMTTLLDSPSGLHGYDITRATGIGSGTLYPMLARLEDRNLLTSEWEAATEQGRPPRRVYTLTNSGRAFTEAFSKEEKAGHQDNLRDRRPA